MDGWMYVSMYGHMDGLTQKTTAQKRLVILTCDRSDLLAAEKG